MYILPQKLFEAIVTIPITNKYGKLKVKMKFNIRNTLISKEVAIIKSDILKHYFQV